MLVLGRKLGEEVWVGSDIRVTIIKVEGGTVRLGIEAPSEVRIERAEISQLNKKPRRLVGTTNKAKLRRAA